MGFFVPEFRREGRAHAVGLVTQLVVHTQCFKPTVSIGLDPDKGQGEAHALWREQVLVSCDLGQILQRCTQPKSRAYGVVYSADETDAAPVLMLIDEVLGLRKPKTGQLHRLPGVKTDAHRWFEALWVDNQLGFKAYCVRSPLTTGLW